MEPKKKRLYRIKKINKVIWISNGILLLILVILYLVKWLSSLRLQAELHRPSRQGEQQQRYDSNVQRIESQQPSIKLTPVPRNLAGNMNAIYVDDILIKHENYERFIDNVAFWCRFRLDEQGLARIDILTEGALDENMAWELAAAIKSRLADRALIFVNGLSERIQRNYE